MSYYTHVKQRELDLEILSKYAKALGYDFSDEIPEMKNYVLPEPDAKYITKPTTLEEALERIEFWRNLYYEEVVKNNKLLEEMRNMGK